MYTNDRTMTRDEYHARRRAPARLVRWYEMQPYYPSGQRVRHDLDGLRRAIPEPWPDEGQRKRDRARFERRCAVNRRVLGRKRKVQREREHKAIVAHIERTTSVPHAYCF